jgi:hypothetical protein
MHIESILGMYRCTEVLRIDSVTTTLDVTPTVFLKSIQSLNENLSPDVGDTYVGISSIAIPVYESTVKKSPAVWL